MKDFTNTKTNKYVIIQLHPDNGTRGKVKVSDYNSAWGTIHQTVVLIWFYIKLKIVIRIHPLETMNVCTRFGANPSHRFNGLHSLLHCSSCTICCTGLTGCTPGAHWGDCISHWECLWIPQKELEKVAGERDVQNTSLLPTWPSPR